MELKLGQVVVTRGVNALMAEDVNFSKHIMQALARYKRHDWGEMDAEDKATNDEAQKSGEDRIFAAYEYPKKPAWRIWIITEWDRSVTTILFPSEY